MTRIKSAVTFSDEIIDLKTEQVIAIILKYAKFLTEKMMDETNITDCVITVPSNWKVSHK